MGFSRKFGGAALCLVLAAGLPAAEFSCAANFTFAALGDTPYTPDEEERFPGLIAAMNREPLAFIVHVGDFKAAVTPCSDELYLQRRVTFPRFFVFQGSGIKPRSSAHAAS